MVFAKQYNYEVLFSRGANPYGSYLGAYSSIVLIGPQLDAFFFLRHADYFEPYQPTHCEITEDLYREEGTIELQAVTEEARRASGDAPHPDQTPRLRSTSGE